MLKNGGFIRETGAMLAIILAGVGGLAHWFLMPRARAWQDNLQHCEAIESNRAQALDLVGIENRVETLRARAAEVVQRNAVAGDTMQYYDTIQQCGKAVGITLGRISPVTNRSGSKGKEKAGLETLAFHVSATGSFVELVEFIDGLQALPVFHQLSGFRITPRLGAEQTELVVAEIDLQFAQFAIDPHLGGSSSSEVSR